MSLALELLGPAALAALAVAAWPGGRPEPVGPGREGGSPRPGVSRDRSARRVANRGRVVVAAVVQRLRRRRDRGFQEVHLLDALAAALEAGMPVDDALRLALGSAAESGELPEAWSELRRSAALGLPLVPSWARVARRTGSPTVAAAGRAWAVATASGAPLAAAIRSSAHASRERHRLDRAVEITTAGARATATVLALLPAGGVGLAALMGIGPLRLYGTTPALICAGAGLSLLLVGHLVVRTMVNRVLAAVS